MTPKPATFKATFDARRTRNMQQLVANLASHAEQVIDARANDRYQGKVAEPRPGLRSGHIPGSLSLPYNHLFDAATGTMKPLDDLRAAFSGAGVKLDAPIVTSCGSGVSALVLTLALYRLGVAAPRSMTARGRNGARRRPAGRDRPGLNAARPVICCARPALARTGRVCCCWAAACRARRARRAAAMRRRSLARCARFLFDAAVRLCVPRFREAGCIDGHGRTAQRRDLQGRGDVAFERWRFRYGLGRGRRPRGCWRSGVSAIAASFTSVIGDWRLGSWRFGRRGRWLGARLPLRVSGFTASAAIGSSVFSAASFSGSAGAFPASDRPVPAVGRRLGNGGGAATFSGTFSATGGSTRSRASVGMGGSFCCGQTPARAAPAATGCWQIARARRAAAPPRQARRPEPTSTARSRRTENENREAWTRVPPCREVCRAVDAEGNAVTTGRTICTGIRARRIRPIREYLNVSNAVCYKIRGSTAPLCRLNGVF